MIAKEIYYRRVDTFPTQFDTHNTSDRTFFELTNIDGRRVTACTYSSIRDMARGLVNYLQRDSGADTLVVVPREFMSVQADALETRPKVEFNMQSVSVHGAMGEKDDLYLLGYNIRNAINRKKR